MCRREVGLPPGYLVLPLDCQEGLGLVYLILSSWYCTKERLHSLPSPPSLLLRHRAQRRPRATAGALCTAPLHLTTEENLPSLQCPGQRERTTDHDKNAGMLQCSFADRNEQRIKGHEQRPGPRSRDCFDAVLLCSFSSGDC